MPIATYCLRHLLAAWLSSPGTQAPKLKAMLTHSPSADGSGHLWQCCPFRVQFADDTIRDTALRYWECNCAVQQSITENKTTTQPAASDRVFRSVSTWLESSSRALWPGHKEATAGSWFGWDCPGLLIQESQGHISDNKAMNSSLPFIPRAATQRQQGDLRTFLDTHSILEQVSKSPCSSSQKLESFLPRLVLHTALKQGSPKGYQLHLPSAARAQT
ncbi:hypothetical protein MC885_000802 [Smutsia gigantea]|nr:hypothetical protein MC885_000802 [Smutsia gigantea]